MSSNDLNGKWGGVNCRTLSMELLGTMALTYVGGWSCIVASSGLSETMSVALAHMLVLTVMIYIGAQVSGAHYNGAVTLGLILAKECQIFRGCMYMVTQLIGTMLGASLLQVMCPQSYISKAHKASGVSLGYPVPMINKLVEASVFEFIGTFLLVFMVFSLVVDKRAPRYIYAIAIGGSVGISVLSFGKISGAACNPWRWFGPALMDAILNGNVSWYKYF